MRKTWWLAVSAVLFTVFGNAQIAAAQPGEPAQRAVLVTGASSGIGLRITELLSSSGTFVYAGARKAEDLERLDGMDNVQAVRLDVTVQEEIDAAVVLIESAGRGLHGIVNNAGVANIGAMIEVEESALQFVFDVNVFGPYRITKAFAPMVIESRGRIVNISSISGVLSGRLFGVYSMSKHAVEAYTDSLAREMVDFDVHVAAVEPGNYSSDIGKNLLERMAARGFDPDSSLYAEDMNRMLEGFSEYDEPGEFNPEPDDVAAAVKDALFSDHPKEHYMVVPYARQAEITIRKALEEVVRLNEGQPYSYERDELIKLLDKELAALSDGA